MGDVSVLLSEANEQIMNADSKEKLLRLLGTYERILERDPSNYEALWSLGRYNVVMVLGYTESRSEKEKHNLAAINYCEQAMNTNPEFKALSAGGGARELGMPAGSCQGGKSHLFIIGMPEWDRTGRSVCLFRKEYGTYIWRVESRR
jgi:hypothetical protein